MMRDGALAFKRSSKRSVIKAAPRMIGGNRHFDAVRGKRACARPPACIVDQHVEAGVFLMDLLRERSNGCLR